MVHLDITDLEARTLMRALLNHLHKLDEYEGSVYPEGSLALAAQREHARHIIKLIKAPPENARGGLRVGGP